jgi:hypothetical protein
MPVVGLNVGDSDSGVREACLKCIAEVYKVTITSLPSLPCSP